MTATRTTGDMLCAQLPPWLMSRLGVRDIRIEQADQLIGGHSNETWKIVFSHLAGADRTASDFVIRWGDPDGVQAPYDIPGQFRMLQALARTAIPVPAPLFLETGSEVIGAPFLTMATAPGITPNRFLRLDDPLRDGKRRAHASMLASIHDVDWRATGIEEILPAPSSPACATEALASVRGWAAQRGLAVERWFVHAFAWLTERAPAVSEIGLLHGDPNLTNYRFDGDKIVAVLDWDAARLSNPLWDVGAVSGAMWLYFADESAAVQDRERQQFLELYNQASGRALDDLAFWEPLFVLRASVLTYHPALDSRMSAILRAKIGAITGFA